MKWKIHYSVFIGNVQENQVLILYIKEEKRGLHLHVLTIYYYKRGSDD